MVLQSMKILLSGLLLLVQLLFLVQPLLAQTKQWREPVTGMEFVWVPAGSFYMGQTESEKAGLIKVMGLEKYNLYCADEVPQHKVKVAGFWVGKVEVTNVQYLRFDPKHDSKKFKEYSLNGVSQPVVEVSWNDAVAYARWLSKKSRKKIRLPNEVEWEYACRAGSTAICYWGDDRAITCAYANVADFTAKQKWPEWSAHDCDDGFAVTAPVGSFKPNNFDLYDMLGNVWEWCDDRPASRGDEDASGITRKNQGCLVDCRVARGSCWDNPARYVRSASRNKRKPGFRGYNIGFRLVMIPDSK